VSGDVKLRSEWLSVLASEFQQPYMADLRAFLRREKAAGKVIYPPGHEFFAALDATPPTAVKVVILGQDPYHGPDQAHGLSFSVRRGCVIPPSLRNIFEELQNDLSLPFPSHGELTSWAEQGVLLLNAALSVEAGQAGSHQGKGWELFTDAIVAAVNASPQSTVFMLWGAHAQRKGAQIDRDRHCVLSAPHPSPLSAHRGFKGCGHFSKANAFLVAAGRGAVDWQVPA